MNKSKYYVSPDPRAFGARGWLRQIKTRLEHMRDSASQSLSLEISEERQARFDRLRQNRSERSSLETAEERQARLQRMSNLLASPN